jgi:hypothetical protein
MNKTTIPRKTAMSTALGILVTIEAVTFLLAALLHLGIQNPILTEPRIIPATIVEGLIGVFLAVSAYGVLARRTWAWAATVAAHVFGVLGVLLGIFATTVGPGPATPANTVYHWVMLVVLLAGLVFLLTPAGKDALGRSGQDSGT